MKKNYLKQIAVFFCALGFSYQGYAQVPANDDCTGAIPLTISTTIASCSPATANTTNATTASYSSLCWSTSYDDDVWYSFTATSNYVFLNISNKGAVGAVGYSIFTGSCAGTELICGDDYSGPVDSIGGLTIGQTYLISAFYSGTSVRGTFDICLGSNYNPPPPPAPPVNDDCSSAIPIAVSTGICAPTTANTNGATTASYSSACWSSSYDDDVWYSFVAGANYVYLNISNQSVSFGSVGYSVRADSCSGTELICGDNASGPTDSIGSLTPGKTYYLSIFYVGTTDRGTFDICLGQSATVGVSEINNINKSLAVFPNPANDNLTVNFKTDKINDLMVKILDMQGKEVYKYSERAFSGEFSKNLDINNLNKGIYLLQIISDKEVATKKIIIQ